MQKITIIGNLTADPIPRTTTNGVNMCSFTVAVDRKQLDRNGQKQTDFFRVNTWRQLAESCGKYLSKGKKVFVSGELQARTYDKDGTTRISLDISADEVEFLSAKELPKSDVNGYVEHGELSGFQNIPESDLPF